MILALFGSFLGNHVVENLWVQFPCLRQKAQSYNKLPGPLALTGFLCPLQHTLGGTCRSCVVGVFTGAGSSWSVLFILTNGFWLQTPPTAKGSCSHGGGGGGELHLPAGVGIIFKCSQELNWFRKVLVIYNPLRLMISVHRISILSPNGMYADLNLFRMVRWTGEAMLTYIYSNSKARDC